MRNPQQVKRLGTEGLEITWSDDCRHQISSKTLRQNCPSAVSLARRGDDSHSKPLTSKKKSLKVIEHSIDEELKLEQIWSVGNYAIGMRWADGHDTGIYTFDFLYELGEKEDS